MDESSLKQRVWAAIDAARDEIAAVAQALWENPELGYKETFATRTVADFFRGMGLEPRENIAVTGCAAEASGPGPGPTVAVLGELDAIVCHSHDRADPDTGAVHACGHHLQVAALAAVARGLVDSGAMEHLAGRVRFLAVPAEEFVELEFRSSLRERGEIGWFGGKQEMLARGLFDDVDLAMMCHALNLPEGKKVLVGPTGNGFIGKEVRFTGREAHAGNSPESGVNALNAAMLAMNAIHAQRETFKDEDRVRVHPILTKGGDIVNVVPADVRMESYVRARTVDAMVDANRKVDRALKSGAMAVGAEVEIRDTPGYLPLLAMPGLDALFRANAVDLVGEAAVVDGGDFTGSFDFGDVSHVIPALHPFTGGVAGALHTREFRVTDMETACLTPGKLMAATVVDLLADGARRAKALCADFTPRLAKDEYLALLNKLTRNTVA